MKDVVIRDIKRKTNLDRKVLEQAARSAYAALAQQDLAGKKAELHIDQIDSLNQKTARPGGEDIKN